MSVPKKVDPILKLWVLFWYNHNESHVNDIRENISRIRLVRLFLYPFLKKEGVNYEILMTDNRKDCLKKCKVEGERKTQ